MSTPVTDTYIQSGALTASSRNSRVDAQYVADECDMPADSTSAAHCNDRDFGTSRWQLSNKTTPLAGVYGRGAMSPPVTQAV